MRAADSMTRPGELVLDGGGQAHRRQPAYRCWFLMTGVRLIAAQGAIDRFDFADVLETPPAAALPLASAEAFVF